MSRGWHGWTNSCLAAHPAATEELGLLVIHYYFLSITVIVYWWISFSVYCVFLLLLLLFWICCIFPNYAIILLLLFFFLNVLSCNGAGLCHIRQMVPWPLLTHRLILIIWLNQLSCVQKETNKQKKTIAVKNLTDYLIWLLVKYNRILTWENVFSKYTSHLLFDMCHSV